MSGKDYGIESITDAFLALKDLDEDITIPNNAKRKGIKKLSEAASVDVRNPEDIDLAQDFRKNDKKEEDSELEVIDVDAYTGGFNLQIAYSTGYTAGLLE